MPRSPITVRALGLFTAWAAGALAAPSCLAQVEIPWVTVGNPGNPEDPLTSFGVVDYEYRIGATEVTNAQYAVFLNAVAATDPNELYVPSMGNDPRGGITRSGSDGAYTYALRPNMADKPVNFVSWYSAARFCNWLTNGQGSGGTETGVYTLDGLDSVSAITRDLSDPDQVFIPNENEWYKAAYHHPRDQGGGFKDYWFYATGSENPPALATATDTGAIANPGGDVANYSQSADWNGQNGNVTTVASAEVPNFYGTYDMNGNVWEWNETRILDERGIRGGSWLVVESLLSSLSRRRFDPTSEIDGIGFRVASPAPAQDPCPADFDGDHDVDLGDFGFFGAAFDSSAGDPSYEQAADFDDDGDVDLGDFGFFGAQFGRGPADCAP